LSTLSFCTFLSVLSCLFQILSFCAVLLSLFLSCSVFSRLSCPSFPSVLTLLSCSITPVRFLSLFCLATLPHLPLPCCPARHLTQSYFPVLSLAVCPVSCCPSCLLLPVLSPVLSVTPDLFCLRNSIQTYNAIYSHGCHSQVFVNL